MHPPQPQIPLWAHAEMLLTTGPKHRIRGADRGAELHHVKRLVEVGFQYLRKAPHDCRAMAMSAAYIDLIAACQARNHRFRARACSIALAKLAAAKTLPSLARRFVANWAPGRS